MATRSDIRDWVREQTLIETSDWSDTRLNALIDEAYNYVATAYDWPFYLKQEGISVTNGDVTQSLPNDWMKTLAIVQSARNVRLTEISFKDAMDRWGNDLPTGSWATEFYFGTDTEVTSGLNLVLVPTPTTSNSYVHYYLMTPTLLTTDSSTPEWLSMYHMILADYCIWKAWQREEDFQKAREARSEFFNGLDRMARHYSNVADDRPFILGQRRNYSGRRVNQNLPVLDGA